VNTEKGLAYIQLHVLVKLSAGLFHMKNACPCFYIYIHTDGLDFCSNGLLANWECI